MALDMERMRALLEKEEQENQNKKDSGNYSFGGGPVYPHWSIPVDSTAVLRFLPDGNDANPFFWADRSIRKIPFTAVKGVDIGNKRYVEVQVPNLEVFEKGLDPIQKAIAPWWDEGRHEEYRTYKKKDSYIYQGLVRVHPGFVDGKGNPVEAEDPENPIRRFVMSPKIHDIIKGIIMNPKVKHSPVDYENGRDFEIIMRRQGQHNNYDTSRWSFEEDSLTVDELEAIEKFGLSDLGEFVPNRPNPEGIRAIEEMFEASVAGLPYDHNRWGEFFKPFGVDFRESSVPTGGDKTTDDNENRVKVDGSKTKALLEKLKSENQSTDSDEKVEKVETSTEKKTASTADLLAKLKARKNS